jgi:hypothetical protein
MNMAHRAIIIKSECVECATKCGSQKFVVVVTILCLIKVFRLHICCVPNDRFLKSQSVPSGVYSAQKHFAQCVTLRDECSSIRDVFR